MKKEVLIQLGKLTNICELTHNEWVDSGHTNEEHLLKIQLFKKVQKQLEEQNRGFLKSKVTYFTISEYLIENYKLSYSELHKKVIELVLKK